jgi:hypothetical protein
MVFFCFLFFFSIEANGCEWRLCAWKRRLDELLTKRVLLYKSQREFTFGHVFRGLLFWRHGLQCQARKPRSHRPLFAQLDATALLHSSTEDQLTPRRRMLCIFKIYIYLIYIEGSAAICLGRQFFPPLLLYFPILPAWRSKDKWRVVGLYISQWKLTDNHATQAVKCSMRTWRVQLKSGDKYECCCDSNFWGPRACFVFFFFFFFFFLFSQTSYWSVTLFLVPSTYITHRNVHYSPCSGSILVHSWKRLFHSNDDDDWCLLHG